jgi:uncharacterized protein (DUF305 family)
MNVQTAPCARGSRAPHSLVPILLLIAGCAASLPPTGADTATAHASDSRPDARSTAAAAHPADVKFMQDMIGHHEQALVLAALAPTHESSEQVLRLAEKIDISQRDEIGMMQDWLTERGQPLPDEHHAHGTLMPGMLTAEQLAQLDRARGREFDRLFLTFMIQHHEGALKMVDMLFASPGAGQDPDIFRFATDVATDQLDEIDVMTHMLAMLATGGSESR